MNLLPDLLVKNNSPKRALIATHNLIEYAGSEILTLELALELRDMGWDVIVAAIIAGAPIQLEFQRQKIPIVELLSELSSLTTVIFDFVWIHHTPVYYELFLTHKIQAHKIVFCSLSHFEPLETIPACRTNIDILLAHSEENKNHIIQENQISPEAITVFPNAVPKQYRVRRRIPAARVLKRIALVSNHLPPELLAAKRLLEQRQLEVEHIGDGGTPLLIQADILLTYDAVVSIGKTIPYCLALQIPAYCYDRFGGPGWLSQSSLSVAAHHNFSGRGFAPKTADEISQEILQGYAHAANETPALRAYAEDKLDLRKNLEQLITHLHGLHSEKKTFVVPHQIERQHASYMTLIRKFSAMTQSYDKEIRRIKTTFSWQITKPIRFIWNTLTRLTSNKSQKNCRHPSSPPYLSDSTNESKACALLLKRFAPEYKDRTDGYIKGLLAIEHYSGRIAYLRKIIGAESFHPKVRVLVSGYGAGSEMIAARQAGLGEVHGLEVDQIWVDVAQLRTAAIPDMHPSLYGGMLLPYADARFDMLMSCHVIEHTKDPQLYLHECMRVLTAGGFLSLEFPHRYHHTKLHTPLPSFEWLPRYMRNAVFIALSGRYSPLSAEVKRLYASTVTSGLQQVSMASVRDWLKSSGYPYTILNTTRAGPGITRCVVRKDQVVFQN